MVSVESSAVLPKFNVDAKPFEMYTPPTKCVREPLSRKSSDSSTGEFSENRYLDVSEEANNGDENDFVPPDDDLRDRIVKQVEFYFSDVNLTKDAFLLKHVKRNKEGNVSLKLISSFKKVKTLTKDWRVVAYSLKSSTKLVVNESGTKVCRRDPLPPYDETTPSRTVIAMNLPLERPTVENVSELFSKCGVIALTRILRPGAPVPPDIKQFLHKHPGIGTCICAVIEFTSVEGAKRAVCEMGGKNNDWRAMHVVEMVKGKKTTPIYKKESPDNDDGKKDDDKKRKRIKKRSPRNDSSKENSPIDGRRRSDGMMYTPVNAGITSLSGKQIFKSPIPEFSIASTGSPWVYRRRMAAKENVLGRRVDNLLNGQVTNSIKTLVPDGVIRLPRGPDGSKGFHARRERVPITLVG